MLACPRGAPPGAPLVVWAVAPHLGGMFKSVKAYADEPESAKHQHEIDCFHASIIPDYGGLSSRKEFYFPLAFPAHSGIINP